MLFSYEEFLESLENHEDEDKRYSFEKWMKISDIKVLTAEPFYTGYVKEFEPVKYRVPEELETDFDWDLLLSLVVSSFSSDYDLVFNSENESDNALPEFEITVSAGDQSITKKMSELMSFQVQRLFEIYCEEQINLHILLHEDENEEKSVQLQRDEMLKRYKIKRVKITSAMKRKELFGV